MRRLQWLALSVIGLWSFAGAARAETKVELKGVHLCCGQCVGAVGKILKEIDGVKGKCDREAKTVTITADNNESAKKAVEALAKAGFHGESDKKDFAMKDDSGAKKEKVKSVTLTGIHNCCGACCKAIKAIVKEVTGVESEDCKPKMDTFTVKGDFDAAELVKKLNEAGFHVKVKE